MPRLQYPFADRDELVEEVAGRRVADPYRWLEDRADVRTIEWEAAQDYLVEPFLAAIPGRERLRERLTALAGAGAITPPVWAGERAFYTRRNAGQEHPALIVRERDGIERVLLDPMALDPTGSTTLDAWEPSVEGDHVAYQLSVGGDEESAFYVIDVTSGERLDGPIDRCRYSPIAWVAGGKELYYVRRLAPEEVPAGEEQYHRRVYRHRLGADPVTDIETHGAGLDPTNYYEVDVSRDGRWLVVRASQGTAPRNDVWIADLAGDAALAPVQVGVDAQWHRLEFHDGLLYVLTDRDAPARRVVAIDPAEPAYERWRDVVPEQPDAVLTDFALVDGPAVLAVHGVDATHRLSWWNDAGTLGDVSDLSGGTIAGVTSRPDAGREVWIGYTDFTTPPSVRTASLAEPSRTTVWAAADRPALPAIDVSEAHCRSADGTAIHLFILAREGTRRGPTVLYGYGGFNIALTPDYAAARLAWVEAGGIWAIANLRGGSEHGERWHRAGMREHKQNVFDDFAAAGDCLITEGWTSRERLGIFGGSNGGLLVGAAITRRPDLCAAAVCSAPLLDMVRYERFGLGRTWNDEYGSADKPEELEWLLAYSPYHHVREGTDYPAVLFTVFDSDTRVDPVHARKMCAALQYATSGDGPILLRRESDVGHGQRSVSRTVGLASDQLAFLAAQLGLEL